MLPYIPAAVVRIVAVEVSNFRGIKSLKWFPKQGINCIMGPGDTGKSTVLDAISLCLGPRPSMKFTEADFYNLDVDQEITVDVTVSDLPRELKRLEVFGDFLRGYDETNGSVMDEPQALQPYALTLRMKVTSDLEPQWTLHSKRAEEQGLERSLSWANRELIAPIRIDDTGDFHLSWRRGSILRKLVEGPDELSSQLTGVMREARQSFEAAGDGLETAMKLIRTTGKDLGIASVGEAKMLIDPESASVSSGALALHDGQNVPLRALGQGSRRFLIAGLHRKAGAAAPALIVDEVEKGLEPHRIERFLQTLGGGQPKHDNQVFLTTHSPVTLRALSMDDLWIARKRDGTLTLTPLESGDDAESAIRHAAEGFLSPKVLICEGKTEAALVQGLDDFRRGNGEPTLLSKGACTVVGSGSESIPASRCFLAADYDTAWLVDADGGDTMERVRTAFSDAGGSIVTWGAGEATEDALWKSVPPAQQSALLDLAISNLGPKGLNSKLESKGEALIGRKITLKEIQALCRAPLSEQHRAELGKLANKCRWYKSDAWPLRHFARDEIFPNLGAWGPSLQGMVAAIDAWASP